jgi:DNA adenine methylase
MSEQLNIFSDNTNQPQSQKKKLKVVNVASVPQRSPFRYPGGKTWFVPTFRQWMSRFDSPKITLIEPFAGGGIISLTAAFENLAKKVLMVELDEEIAAVWNTIINQGEGEWLAGKIVNFDLTVENAKKIIEQDNPSVKERSFITILKNRIYHGGILANGSGMLKRGENGKGIASRWYPETLRKRIENIGVVRHKIKFLHGDAFETIEEYSDDKDAVFFVDPPYTVAGKRLYTHFDIDHRNLFAVLSRVKGSFLITYDDAEEVREWAEEFNLEYRRIPMKTTHHRTKYELIISDSFDWLED